MDDLDPHKSHLEYITAADAVEERGSELATSAQLDTRMDLAPVEQQPPGQTEGR